MPPAVEIGHVPRSRRETASRKSRISVSCPIRRPASGRPGRRRRCARWTASEPAGSTRRAVERHHHHVPGALREQHVRAVGRHAGRQQAGPVAAEGLGLTGAVGGLPEETATCALPNIRRCPSPSTPERSRLGTGRQLSERLACGIPHPDVVLLVVDGHRHPRPVRRQARLDVGARGPLPQRLLPRPANPPTPACAPLARAASGASTYTRVPSAATSKSPASCGVVTRRGSTVTGVPRVSSRARSNGTARSVPSAAYTRCPLGT